MSLCLLFVWESCDVCPDMDVLGCMDDSANNYNADCDCGA